MSKHKFCVDCVHYHFADPFGRFGGPVFVDCHHPSAPRDPVPGTHASCASERTSSLGCGPSGTRWQRKPVNKPQPKPRRWWWPW